MRRIRSGCCARVSGHAIAVPPRGRSAASVLKTCGPAGQSLRSGLECSQRLSLSCPTLGPAAAIRRAGRLQRWKR